MKTSKLFMILVWCTTLTGCASTSSWWPFDFAPFTQSVRIQGVEQLVPRDAFEPINLALLLYPEAPGAGVGAPPL